MFFWQQYDLKNTLLNYGHDYCAYHYHTRLAGATTNVLGAKPIVQSQAYYEWTHHCHELFPIPVAA